MPEKADLYIHKIALPLAFTAILLGYFMVWLPQPLAGLSFIGIEIGEWVKFMPQMRSGEVVASRNLFYLPPVTLALSIIFWTWGEEQPTMRKWLAPGFALAVSILVFPALEVIQEEPMSEWIPRLLMIAIVAVVALVLGGFVKYQDGRFYKLKWLLVALLGFLGAAAPLWAYLTIRPLAAELFRHDVGIGAGLLLNTGGHLVVVLVSLLLLTGHRDQSRS